MGIIRTDSASLVLVKMEDVRVLVKGYFANTPVQES